MMIVVLRLQGMPAINIVFTSILFLAESLLKVKLFGSGVSEDPDSYRDGSQKPEVRASKYPLTFSF